MIETARCLTKAVIRPTNRLQYSHYLNCSNTPDPTNPCPNPSPSHPSIHPSTFPPVSVPLDPGENATPAAAAAASRSSFHGRDRRKKGTCSLHPDKPRQSSKTLGLKNAFSLFQREGGELADSDRNTTFRNVAR